MKLPEFVHVPEKKKSKQLYQTNRISFFFLILTTQCILNNQTSYMKCKEELKHQPVCSACKVGSSVMFNIFGSVCTLHCFCLECLF